MTPPPCHEQADNRKALPMSSSLRLLAVLVATVALAVSAGCSQDRVPGGGDSASGSGPGSPSGSSASLAEGSCWSGALLGADPQDVLAVSGAYDVPYFAAARALADRPAFSEAIDCDRDHAVEVYKVVRLPKLEARLQDYTALLRTQTPLYGTVARSVAQACMTGPLAQAVAKSGIAAAVMAPVLPAGATLGWAPASPEQWRKGERVFGCTFTWSEPQPTRYATVFTKEFPTGKRTCIDSRTLVFVDCARKHDRERIAVIEAREAVAAGTFPGRKAVRTAPTGRYVAIGDARYRRLDAACTAYLRSVSTTKKLTGVANIDVDEWPTPTGSYPIYCEADTSPDEDSLITQGSVYDRG